jgi:hypothetical protein
MEDVSYADIVTRADWILSILSPSEAVALSTKIHDTWAVPENKRAKRLVYADCNAVSPETIKAIAKQWHGAEGVVVLDAGIIGGPPSTPGTPDEERYDPTIYASARWEDLSVLKEFVDLGKERDVKIVALEGEGAGVGDASALKMSYAVGRALLRGGKTR